MDGLTIGGLAERAGVNVETVRYYERRGLLTPPDRTDRHRYTEQSVQRLALIRRAKNLGFTLAEIGELLEAADRPDATNAGRGPSAEDILDAAHAKLREVESRLRELAALRLRLARLVRACAAGEDGCVTLLGGCTP
jgi:DNA-binding transcriptional MerR regulator